MVLVPFMEDARDRARGRRRPGAMTDPRINYLLALAGDIEGSSVFQSFDEALLRLHWAFEVMVKLPATVYEPVAKLRQLMALRACGLGAWRWQPLPAQAILQIPFSTMHPFYVVFSDHPAAAAQIAEAFRGRGAAPFHISSQDVEGAHKPDTVTLGALRDHFLALVDSNSQLGLAAMREVISGWKGKPQERSRIDFKGNYTVLPNQMTLRSVGVVPRREIPDWSSDDPREYLKAILQSAAQIDRFRAKAVIGEEVRLIPPRPDTWLVSPSLLHDFKRRIDMERVPERERPAVRDLIRMLERQQLFGVPITEERLKRLDESEVAQGLKATRNLEAKLFAAAVGAAAAGTMASVYRLPPGLGRVRGAVRHFADNARAEAETSPSKVARLFADIQDQLKSNVAPEILERVAHSTWGVKAVTDTPLEWLPVDGLPLSLYRDLSRIPATPGNLTVMLLARHEPIRIPVADFSEILVISAFEEGDRFDQIRRGFDVTEPAWAGRLDIRFVRVGTVDELVEALNSFHGPLLIFDGHGVHGSEGRGRLVLGKEEVDIWSLAGDVRVPPIVILSACDTHAVDRSWSTVANAFLRLGARTVLATLLPIGVLPGAVFASRLIFRLAAFLPIACRALGRVVRWSEVVGGMLRMQFITDVVRPMLVAGEISQEDYETIVAEANLLAHGTLRRALDYLQGELIERGVLDAETFAERVRLAIAGSDTIRYAQLGSPETILIGSIQDMPAELHDRFAPMGSGLTPVWRTPPSPAF
ncbi:MAG TPA: CHAT domain-containing protein [Allosphingosinicella sp.]|nr:CHAT domain-containing protein [Allosphingosinicella sp.]